MTVFSFCVVCQQRAELTLLENDAYECDCCGTRVDENLTTPMRLRLMREILGYTQTEASHLSNIPQRRISNYELGKSKRTEEYDQFLKNQLKKEYKLNQRYAS